MTNGAENFEVAPVMFTMSTLMRAFQIVIERRPPRTVSRSIPSLEGVVDVLVDGTNVTARIGQDHALPLLRDLAWAASDLANGRQARATVRFYEQKDGWALGLERTGDQALLTVFQGGASAHVAVFERPVRGEALLRGIHQALAEVLDRQGAPVTLFSDLSAARRVLASATWAVDPTPPQTAEIRIEGNNDAPISFSADFSMRVRTSSQPQTSSVERNDLHSLLFRGTFRVRVGDSLREVRDTFAFLIAETLVHEASEVLEAWDEGKALYHRVETAGVLIAVRLAADGTLSFTFGGPRTSGLRNGVTFPTMSVPAFVGAVMNLSRALSRAVIRQDRTQLNNLRMRLFRDAVKEASEALQEAVRDDAQYNEAPESYQAYADAMPSTRSTDPQNLNLSRIRFTPAWQASVPGIELNSTFMFNDRIVIGGARELACIDKSTGRMLWRVPIDRGISVALSGGVARLAPDGYVTVYDLETGETTLRVRLSPRVGGAPAGAVVNAPGLPRLLVVSEGERHITAIDIVSGEVRWRHALGRGRFFKVRRAGRLLVVSSSEPTLNALDAASGETVWRIRDRQRFCRPAAYDNNDLFVVAGDTSTVRPAKETLHALDPWTGVTRWTCALPGTRRSVGAPLAAEDVVIVVTHDHRGTGFVAINRKDGTVQWSAEDGTAPSTSAWLVVDDLLVYNGDAGDVAALDLHTGNCRWRKRFECNADGDIPRHLDLVYRSGALFIPQRLVNIVRPEDGDVLGQVPAELVPDLIRVDDLCNIVVVEESGHLAAFTAGPRLALVKTS